MEYLSADSAISQSPEGRGERGDTLVEALAAILVGGLSLLMLATAIMSSSSIVRRTDEHMERYYQEASELAQKTSGSSGGAAGTLTLEIGGSPVGIVDATGTPVTVYSGQELGKDVYIYV